ncbi:MAG: hypothetical protein MUC39_05125 [Candidatus Omnitrophica bacterium]|jgi:hypothetical protein|nr:hypothetical protein [Candidatus Omnitrophota bacterium]
MKSIAFSSRSGCLLPALILFNLFFGRAFFEAPLWLGIELVLIAIFIINAVIFSKKIFSFAAGGSPRAGVIDIEGKIVEDTRHLPESPRT